MYDMPITLTRLTHKYMTCTHGHHIAKDIIFIFLPNYKRDEHLRRYLNVTTIVSHLRE